ncbi:sensor histidine kinase [Ruania halotolerans]|uniref:sensor histidine kinase n=1 Tax=Ruania halotolerans TaxID=2897773 RepID=UPI001E42423F|nr:histidine kinase [Ruania halotolerans]UFU08244.1 histidine kinase [Ruania halotolerans]
MIRTFLLRGAWLMLGAAIGLAAALLTGTVAGIAVQDSTAVGLARPTVLGGAVGALLVAAVVGLLPGVREIQVTAALTLLRVPAPLVVPEPMRARHRAGTALWTVLQTAAGLISGFCVFGLLPGAVLTATWTAFGNETQLATLGWEYPIWLSALIGIGLLGAAIAGPLGCGWAAVRLAPLLLGPTAADRLALAETRLAEERRHTALARELHDGIGHALSIISIQAAAAQRVVISQPDRIDAALAVIEQTSRGAQDELDHLLGLLRNPDAPPVRGTVRAPSTDDLVHLVERHRAAGLTVDLRDTHSGVPQLVWNTALNILAEALTNAHRHGGDAPVTVTIDQTADVLELRVTNALPTGGRQPRTSRSTRGIAGMQERAAVLEGTVTAGPVPSGSATAGTAPAGADREWHVVATIPVPADSRPRSEQT